MSKMFMNVKEVMEVLEVSESYAYKLMKRLNRELQAIGCQTIAGKVDRKYFYEQFYGTRSNDGRNQEWQFTRMQMGSNLSKRVSFRTDYRYAVWEDYVIIYKIGKEYVEIYRVVNRYQDITRIFE